ncbi:MAG: cobalamin biosynthesis protein [Acidimicrobiales bacterium]
MVSRAGRRALGAAAGLVADRALGDPPDALHPVAWFGRTMGVVERRTWAPSRRAGAAYAVVGVATGVGAGVAVPSTAVATWVASGSRSLHSIALEIADALRCADLDAARHLVPSLVGRDPDSLDPAGIARATIESVAENTTDAIVAPALWAAAAGAPGVMAHRAADTMDSMVGHRSERYGEFGWAAASLDDAMAWVPARVGALLVATVRPRRAVAVARAVRHHAPAHPSPNAGVIEAAFAAALDVTLGGPTTYRGTVEERPLLGDGHAPDAGDIVAAVSLSHEITTALTCLLAGYGSARIVASLARR